MADKTLQEAFVAAWAEIENPKKNATNPAFRSKYADLQEMLRVVKPVLAEHGIALVQPPASEENPTSGLPCVGVNTLLFGHGEQMDFGYYTVPLVKHDAQGAGSAITYCRRYALAAIFGLAQEDDDGNTASEKPAAAKPKPKKDDSEVIGLIKESKFFNTTEKLYALLGLKKGATVEAINAAWDACDDGQRAVARIVAMGGQEVTA